MSGEKASEMRGEQSPDDTDLELDRLRAAVREVSAIARGLGLDPDPHCTVCVVVGDALRRAVEGLP